MTGIAAALMCCCADRGGDEDPWPESPCPACAPYVDMTWDGSVEVESQCCDKVFNQCVPPHRCRPCEAHFQFGGDFCRDCPGHGCFLQKVNRKSFRVSAMRLFARPGIASRCQWIGVGQPQFFDINWCCTSAPPDISQCSHGDTIPYFGLGSVQFKANISCRLYPTEGYVGELWVRFGNQRCLRLDPWKLLLTFIPPAGGNICAACPDFLTHGKWKPIRNMSPFTLRSTCNIFPNYGPVPGPFNPGCGSSDLDPVPWSAFDLGSVITLKAPTP